VSANVVSDQFEDSHQREISSVASLQSLNVSVGVSRVSSVNSDILIVVLVASVSLE